MPEEETLKVLLFSGAFEVRGTSAYTIALAEHLQEHCVEATIVCPSARSIPPQKREQLRIHEFPRLSYPVWGRFVMESLRRLLDDSPPDLIHIQSRFVLPQGSWLSRKLQRPFVLSIHDYMQPGESIRFDSTWGQRIIAVSDSVRTDLLNQAPVKSELVTVIRSGVEVDTAVATLPILDPSHVPVVGTASPLEQTKGVPFLLGAAQRVLAEFENVQFLISGAGPQEANLRRLTRELRIAQNVTFVPNLLDFSESLAAMDIFCLPSLRQGLGTIMLQAMALGKPVIATDAGGVQHFLRDNENALLVRPSDSAHLAQQILTLLRDPVKTRAIAVAGRDMVRQEFNNTRMVSETAELYREVLRVPSRP